MNVTSKHFKKILKIIERMHEHDNELEMRADIANPVLDLLNADYFASFCWDSDAKSYGKGIYLNMDDSNIRKYCDYYQYRDPITIQLAQKKIATTVSEILPHQDLRKTEFFNDFLLADGLYHGINLHLYNFDENIGDIRVWRKNGRGDFDDSSCTMLDLLRPHMIQVIKGMRRHERYSNMERKFSIEEQCTILKKRYKLTDRETHVTRLLLKGERDDSISHRLHIGITTVRTHVKNIFRKMEINSRTKLQVLLYDE